MTDYVFPHAWELEQRRLEVLQQVFDPPTVEALGRVPIPEAGECLEVGAGAGSIARWLCERVGPNGRVVATDLDTGFLERLEEKNLEVRRHDIVTDELEEGVFDLVHARLVLDHLPERAQIVPRLAAALRPGGWLVLEDFEWSSLVTGPGCTSGDVLDRIHEAMPAVFPTGAPETGRLLPGAFRAAGLVDIVTEGRVHVAQGGNPVAVWWQMSLAALQARFVSQGLVTEAEFSAALAACADDGVCVFLPTMVTAWGRRPLG